jgi:hypothetical protein
MSTALSFPKAVSLWIILLAITSLPSPLIAFGPVDHEAIAQMGALPRQLQARQVIVTLAPDTPERWALVSEELARVRTDSGRRVSTHFARGPVCCLPSHR